MSTTHQHAGEQPLLQRLFNQYGEATRFARKLAICSASTVTVRRHVNGWVACWPPFAGPVKARPDSLCALLELEAGADQPGLPDDSQEVQDPERADFDFIENDDCEDAWAEATEACGCDDVDQLLEDIRGELLDDCEDWARSDEEGWYYADD